MVPAEHLKRLTDFPEPACNWLGCGPQTSSHLIDKSSCNRNDDSDRQIAAYWRRAKKWQLNWLHLAGAKSKPFLTGNAKLIQSSSLIINGVDALLKLQCLKNRILVHVMSLVPVLFCCHTIEYAKCTFWIKFVLLIRTWNRLIQVISDKGLDRWIKVLWISIKKKIQHKSWKCWKTSFVNVM